MNFVVRLFTIGLLSVTFLAAQKPVEVRSFEFGRAVELPSTVIGNERIDQRTGFPAALYNPAIQLSPATPEVMAREFLDGYRSRLGLSQADLDNLVHHNTRSSAAGHTVRFRQHLLGLPVNKGELTISITPDNRVGFVANSFVYGVELNDAVAHISPNSARGLAAAHIGLRGATNFEKNDLMIFARAGESFLAYRVLLNAADPQGEWECMVDARNGELLKVENVAFYYHEHLAAIKPSARPFHLMLLDGTGNVFDPDPLSTAAASYNDTGYEDNGDNNTSQLLAQQRSVPLRDITFSGGQYWLNGPWAEVQDFESPSNGLFSQASSNWNFNRSDDAFEAVNVYYHIDASMRYLNDVLGLNIRPFDYSGGVRYDPSGLGGSDNSYYSGGQQRLALGEGGVDDAEDSDVIHHELGHGLHDWVTSGSLSQVNGLSEGSGDYWAASYNRSLGHWTSADSPYHWVFRWDGHNPFWNGRSTNISQTYPGGLTGGIHYDGQLWSTSMMLVWDAIGKMKTDLIFWEGLGMTNSATNQNDAANAVYQAANNLGCTNAERLSIHTILSNRGYSLPTFVLPVEWVRFEATQVSKDVKLSWTTAQEVNNDFFTVERSVDGGRIYQALERIPAAANQHDYQFTDLSPVKGNNTYRIRQTDFDGSFDFSPLRNLRFERKDNWSIAPNPADDYLTISQLSLGSGLPIYVEVLDLSGRIQFSSDYEAQEVSGLRLSVAHLKPGVYLLRLRSGEASELSRFVKE